MVDDFNDVFRQNFTNRLQCRAHKQAKRKPNAILSLSLSLPVNNAIKQCENKVLFEFLFTVIMCEHRSFKFNININFNFVTCPIFRAMIVHEF